MGRSPKQAHTRTKFYEADVAMMRRISFDVPRTVPAGKFLWHNHAQHSVDMPDGLKGFRYYCEVCRSIIASS
jgi:hypothetical protein